MRIKIVLQRVVVKYNPYEWNNTCENLEQGLAHDMLTFALITTALRCWGSSYLVFCGVGHCPWSRVTTALTSLQCGEGFAPVTPSSEAWCLSQTPRTHWQELCVMWFLADHVAWNGNSLRHTCPHSVPSPEKNGPALGFVVYFIPVHIKQLGWFQMSAEGQCLHLNTLRQETLGIWIIFVKEYLRRGMPFLPHTSLQCFGCVRLSHLISSRTLSSRC